MERLNYHHLLYFWTVARTGSIANASKELLLAPSTISAHVRRLEETLGKQLRYSFEHIGEAEQVRAQFYAISVERKIKSPAVGAICDAARHHAFGSHRDGQK